MLLEHVCRLKKCVNNSFLGRLSCYPCQLHNPEGNRLAATEFVRLLEVSESVKYATAKQSNRKTENMQLLGSNSRAYNPTT